MVSLLYRNKEWIFSGVGVVITVAVIGWLFSSTEPEPSRASNSSTEVNYGVRVGGDVENSNLTVYGADENKSPKDVLAEEE